MRFSSLNAATCFFLVVLPCFVSAEFYSDVDSKRHDEAKALEIKAKDFWQGLMESAEGLETTDNALLCVKLDRALKTLPAEYTEVRKLFNDAIEHLATADSMLFDEASRSKMLAYQRLENGPSTEAFADYVTSWADSFFVAVNHFTGEKTYQKLLAKHVISRLKDIKPTIHHAADMAPQMLKEADKASACAHGVLRSLDKEDARVSKRALPIKFRKLAHDIITSAQKQRRRFSNYLLSSIENMAQDVVEKNEKPLETVMKASLRGMNLDAERTKASVHSEIVKRRADYGLPGKSVPVDTVDAEPPLMFFDGVPVGATPIEDYASNVEHIVDV